MRFAKLLLPTVAFFLLDKIKRGNELRNTAKSAPIRTRMGKDTTLLTFQLLRSLALQGRQPQESKSFNITRREKSARKSAKSVRVTKFWKPTFCRTKKSFSIDSRKHWPINHLRRHWTDCHQTHMWSHWGDKHDSSTEKRTTKTAAKRIKRSLSGQSSLIHPLNVVTTCNFSSCFRPITKL